MRSTHRVKIGDFTFCRAPDRIMTPHNDTLLQLCIDKFEQSQEGMSYFIDEEVELDVINKTPDTMTVRAFAHISMFVANLLRQLKYYSSVDEIVADDLIRPHTVVFDRQGLVQ